MGASQRRCRDGSQRAAPAARQRENDVEARKARRRLISPPGIALVMTEQGLAVAAAEQEDETLQVLAQLAAGFLDAGTDSKPGNHSVPPHRDGA